MLAVSALAKRGSMDIHERIAKWYCVDDVSFFRQMKLPPGSVYLDFDSKYGEYETALALAYLDSTVYTIDKNAK